MQLNGFVVEHVVQDLTPCIWASFYTFTSDFNQLLLHFT